MKLSRGLHRRTPWGLHRGSKSTPQQPARASLITRQALRHAPRTVLTLCHLPHPAAIQRFFRHSKAASRPPPIPHRAPPNPQTPETRVLPRSSRSQTHGVSTPAPFPPSDLSGTSAVPPQFPSRAVTPSAPPNSLLQPLPLHSYTQSPPTGEAAARGSPGPAGSAIPLPGFNQPPQGSGTTVPAEMPAAGPTAVGAAPADPYAASLRASIAGFALHSNPTIVPAEIPGVGAGESRVFTALGAAPVSPALDGPVPTPYAETPAAFAGGGAG